MVYKPIESYGIIGDMHSVALVGMDGSIDWCCLPYFDSPSIFAAILDDKKGGSFRLAATELVFEPAAREPVPIALGAMCLLHYGQRTFVFPALIRARDKRTPVSIVATAASTASTITQI